MEPPSQPTKLPVIVPATLCGFRRPSYRAAGSTFAPNDRSRQKVFLYIDSYVVIALL